MTSESNLRGKNENVQTQEPKVEVVLVEVVELIREVDEVVLVEVVELEREVVELTREVVEDVNI